MINEHDHTSESAFATDINVIIIIYIGFYVHVIHIIIDR
jgi:hypothetical protein